MSNKKFLLAVVLPIAIAIVVAVTGVSVYFGVFYDGDSHIVAPDAPVQNEIYDEATDTYPYKFDDVALAASALFQPIYDENHLQIGWKLVEIMNLDAFFVKKETGNLAFPKVYQKIPILQIGSVFGNVSNDDKQQIRNVQIPESVTALDGTFWGVSNLERVNFPSGNNVETLGASAFDGCAKIDTLEFLKVTKLSDRCFYGCSLLNSVSFGKVEEVGESCFEGCSTLQSFGDLQNTKIFGSRCFSNTRVVIFEFAQSTEYIGSKLFEGCSYLTRIILDKGIAWSDELLELANDAFPNKEIQVEIFETVNLTLVDALKKLKNQTYRLMFNVHITIEIHAYDSYFKSVTVDL